LFIEYREFFLFNQAKPVLGDLPEMQKSSDNTKVYKLLDQFFWLLWAALPVFLWLNYRAALDVSGLQAELPASCADLVSQAADFSSSGKAVLAGYFLADGLVYATLLALAHVTIHRFAMGQVFVSNTLRFLTQLGAVLILWPLFTFISSNALGYGIMATGDAKSFAPSLAFDIGPLAIGLLILTVRSALEHAISLKQDQDLTI
jgi:hypothetical protein